LRPAETARARALDAQRALDAVRAEAVQAFFHHAHGLEDAWRRKREHKKMWRQKSEGFEGSLPDRKSTRGAARRGAHGGARRAPKHMGQRVSSRIASMHTPTVLRKGGTRE
jgi:hypothetical protein